MSQAMAICCRILLLKNARNLTVADFRNLTRHASIDSLHTPSNTDPFTMQASLTSINTVMDAGQLSLLCRCAQLLCTGKSCLVSS